MNIRVLWKNNLICILIGHAWVRKLQYEVRERLHRKISGASSSFSIGWTTAYAYILVVILYSTYNCWYRGLLLLCTLWKSAALTPVEVSLFWILHTRLQYFALRSVQSFDLFFQFQFISFTRVCNRSNCTVSFSRVPGVCCKWTLRGSKLVSHFFKRASHIATGDCWHCDAGLSRNASYCLRKLHCVFTVLLRYSFQRLWRPF